MPLQIELTSGWSPERMADVLPSVRACLQKFVAEFPDEFTEDHLLGEVIHGRRLLWVVYDVATPNRAVLTILTEKKTNNATGNCLVEITAIGGERIREALPLLEHIEEWAAQNGADETFVIGRFGWIPLLAERGYAKKAVILKKRLN